MFQLNAIGMNAVRSACIAPTPLAQVLSTIPFNYCLYSRLEAAGTVKNTNQ